MVIDLDPCVLAQEGLLGPRTLEVVPCGCKIQSSKECSPAGIGVSTGEAGTGGVRRN